MGANVDGFSYMYIYIICCYFALLFRVFSTKVVYILEGIFFLCESERWEQDSVKIRDLGYLKYTVICRQYLHYVHMFWPVDIWYELFFLIKFSNFNEKYIE